MAGFILVYVPRQIGPDFISSYGNILHKYFLLSLIDGDRIRGSGVGMFTRGHWLLVNDVQGICMCVNLLQFKKNEMESIDLSKWGSMIICKREK